MEGDFDKRRFYDAVKGMEALPEGGERCERCYALRLLETAKQAMARGFDYFATTLTISPLKNARTINTIGEQIGEQHGISYLCSDFKKKTGSNAPRSFQHSMACTGRITAAVCFTGKGRMSMLPQGCLSEDGYIINQGMLREIPFGNYPSSKMGAAGLPYIT